MFFIDDKRDTAEYDIERDNMESRTMQIKERLENSSTVILEIEGDLVVSESDAILLRNSIQDVLGRGLNAVVVDIGHVRFLNTVGLGVLIGILKKVREAGGKLVLANISATISRILMVTDLIKVFESYESIEEAVEAVSNPSS